MNHPSNPPIEPELLTRFLSGDTSAHENEQVQAWLEASEQNKAHFKQFSLLWSKSAHLKDADLIDTKADWQQVKTKINIVKQAETNKQMASDRSLLTHLVRIAAICILIIGLGWLTYKVSQKSTTEKAVVALTSTQTSQITLPDGTKVFLNKNSTVTYPPSFGVHTREVQLQGEAFFEVVKNPQKPFLIKTGNTTTEVLGTSFNVYENGQNVAVNVVTGKVALYETDHQDNKITMVAGEEGSYQNNTLSKSISQNPNFLSWKTGVLTFKNTPLLQVIHDINKHYTRHLVLETEELETCTITSTFNNQPFSQVLEELQLVLPVLVFKEGNDIIISGEGCSDDH